MKLLILILLLSFTVEAKVAKANLEARCFQWGVISGMSSNEVSRHFKAASKTLPKHLLFFELGFADGIVNSLAKTKEGKRLVSSGIYVKYCLQSI